MDMFISLPYTINMASFRDLTGLKFGRLTVLGISKKIKSGKRYRYYWKCLCDCGNSIEARTDSLTSGNVKSCGCLKKEQDKANLTANHRHKLSKTHLWDVYYSMRSRCYDPRNTHYQCYGGRGIKICDEWSESIDNFAQWSFENGYYEGCDLEIDRIDNNGNYEPGNCRWITRKQNCRNRSNNVMIRQEDGSYITLVELAEKLGKPYSSVYQQYRKYGIKRSELKAGQPRANSPDSEQAGE